VGNIIGSLIRTSAFLRKEIIEILRQPKLILSLVLGPFFILLIFGIGYRNEPQALRTLFITPEGSELAQQIEEIAPNLGPQLIYEGVSYDAEAALERLQQGELDVIVVTPADAYDTIRSNQQAVFTLYHHEIDPFQVDYIVYFGQFYTDIVNKRILQEITAQSQAEASTLQEELSAARESAAATRRALEAGDEVAAQQNQRQLSQNVDNVSLAVGASLGLLSSISNTIGPGQDTESLEILGDLDTVQQSTNELGDSNSGSSSSRAQKAAEVEQDLARLEERLVEFQNVPPDLLVSPFRSETKSITPFQPTPSIYFAPAVVALLLQHLAVTFAGLSIVRERSLGTTELFRVSPLSSLEALIGKYLSYMLFGGFIAATLALILVYVLRIPMLGSWWNFAIVIAAILFASLSIGFVISLISDTDSQAVQYSMFVLLTSVFFSGFIMSLDLLWEPVRIISWMLPATYGSILLREISLLGAGIDLLLLAGLLAIGLVMSILAWLLMRRFISSSRD